MKKLIYLFALAPYLIMAFYHLTLNPFYWDASDRVIVAVLAIPCGMIAVGLYNLSKNNP